MKIQYENLNLGQETLGIIHAANETMRPYRKAGQMLTVRQLYYRFIATDRFPETWVDDKYNALHGLRSGTKNTVKNYKRMGSIVVKGRMAGHIPWDAIEDRTRSLKSRSHWDSPDEIIRSVADQFHVDLWEGQDKYLEVWIEKDALSGVFSGPCHELDVPLFSCRGYGSMSEMWAAGQRLGHFARQGRTPIILHFGDHDPSGMDMSRDITDRLSTFAGQGVEVHRVALNMDQVEEYDPPPNPAKVTDSRYESYAKEYGEDSWELDALEPVVLSGLVVEHIDRHLDRSMFDEQLRVRRQGRALFSSIADNWNQIADEYQRKG